MDKCYVLCPHCGKKLFRIDKNSSYDNIYVWCKICRKEIHIKSQRAETK